MATAVDSPQAASGVAVAGVAPEAQWGLRLAAGLRGLCGWRRHVAAMGLGVCATAALPPLHLLPLLIPAFVGLVWLIDTPHRRGAFAAGWWFGFGHFTTGFYWIAYALATDMARFGWMIPFAVGGLAAGIAIFSGIAAALAHRLGEGLTERGDGAVRALLLAGCWVVIEWLRAWAFTGFPWNLIGTVWAISDPLMQGAAWIGIYGLGLITVAAAGIPAVLGDEAPETTGGRIWLPIAAAGAVVAGLWGAGSLRLSMAEAAMVPDVRLRLVQANIQQNHKWQPELREAHFHRHLNLTLSPGIEQITDVIWPETAVPFLLDQDPVRLSLVAAAAPQGGLIITGAPRATPPHEMPFRVWNSLQAVDDGGRIVASYDKFHLVPFGEYVPLRQVLPLPKITQGGTDFTPGPGPRSLSLPGLPPASPLICYEVIFPGAVIDAAHRPGWMLNITNDAWFGLSAGPHQHFASARFRAVEEGVPLVRADNTGISAIIDGHGRVVAMLGLGEEGVLDGPLPQALPPTLYARFGDTTTLPLLLGITLITRNLFVKRRNKRDAQPS